MRNWKERVATVALLVLVLVFVASVAYAVSLSTYDGVTYTTLLDPDALAPGTTTGTATDVSAAQGLGTFIISLSKPFGNGATYTNKVYIEHCSTSGGTYTPLTNSAGTVVQAQITSNQASVTKIKCDMGVVEAYVRAVQTNSVDTGCASCVVSYY